MNVSVSRRKFIGTTAAALSGLALSHTKVIATPAILSSLSKPNSRINGVHLGVITYSFRSMPSSTEQIIKCCTDTSISAIELMGNTGKPFSGAPHTSTEPNTFPSGPRP